ncbi:MAG: Holliday junction branch migration protein RuvA [Flavobacteriales bacterium]|nr:Holliday junction branch migration protein RuvA [Flavobacteriales bacterium]MCX7650977.1 Holliday junction branch migration protein RuvA [Flavobacteriales bacterium]MDW8431832.1 Holliday junction branch migration protein RuvA [Flavobacteriales bacterium]
MIAHLRGQLHECTPTFAVVECGGVGYGVAISLHTYEAIAGEKTVLLYTEKIIGEKSETLYGFSSREERDMFRLLISVSGVGPATARMVLSALRVSELVHVISTGDVRRLKSVKGVGEKSAQRIILDLKEKVAGWSEGLNISKGFQNSTTEEALAALSALGFSRTVAEKALLKVPDYASLPLEALIKEILKNL